jgi:hypothetical protein
MTSKKKNFRHPAFYSPGAGVHNFKMFRPDKQISVFTVCDTPPDGRDLREPPECIWSDEIVVAK